MAAEDPRAAVTRQWLAKAQEDLGVAEHVARGTPFLGGVVFHCQQAAEKALKAFLTWQGRPFRRTHQLVELLQQCAGADSTFSSLQGAAEALTPYAWEFRYPGDLEPPSPENAQEALQLARQVMEFVLQRLPEDVRS